MYWNFMLLPEIVLEYFPGFFWTSLTPSQVSILRNLDKMMIWQCAWYIFLKYELSFWHRDHCRVSSYHIFPKNFKTGLRFEENVQYTLSNHDFVQDIERMSRMSKKTWGELAKTRKFHNIWNYRFYWNSSDKEKGIQVKIFVTLFHTWKSYKILASH